MYYQLKVFVLLCGLLSIEQANADSNYGFPGTRDGDFQKVTITEYAPEGRTVTLTTPEALKAFAGHFGDWGMGKRMSKTYSRDFFNMFPVRYQVTVQGPQDTYTSLVGVMNMTRQARPDGPYSEPWLSYVCFTENTVGSFTMFVLGPERAYREPDTPFEEYLKQLFPPRRAAATELVAGPASNSETKPAWFARKCVIPVWLLIIITLIAAAAVCWTLRFQGRRAGHP